MIQQQYISFDLGEGKKTEYVAVRMERGLFYILKRQADAEGIDLSSFIRQQLRRNMRCQDVVT